MSEPPFDRGGFLPAGPVRVFIDVDECILRAADVKEGRAVCCRGDEAHLNAIGKSDVPHDVPVTANRLHARLPQETEGKNGAT